MNKQTGKPVLYDVPLGAVFSVEDPQNPHAMLPMQRRVYEESKIATRNSFWPDDRTRRLNYYQAEHPFDYRMPPEQVRGLTTYQDGDFTYNGVFWKPGRGNVQPTSLPWPPGCCPVVDAAKPLQRGLSVDAQNSFVNFPSGWPVSRHLKG